MSDVSSILSKLDESFENTQQHNDYLKLTTSEKEESLSAIKIKLTPLKQKRGQIKRKITCLLKTLDKDLDLNIETLEASTKHIPDLLIQNEKFDEEIVNLITESEVFKFNESYLDEELITQSFYMINSQKVLSKLRSRYPKEITFKTPNEKSESHKEKKIDKLINSLNWKSEFTVSKLNCEIF